MSKETRQQKRELRKLSRSERKQSLSKLIEAVNAIKDVHFESQTTYKDKFKVIWPVMKPALEFSILLKITGEKYDMSAQNLILIGDKMNSTMPADEDALVFLHDLSQKWETIEMVLEILKIATNDETDQRIDKLIEIGEWVFEN